MIVPTNTNSTVDNAFTTGEQSYKYYNEFIWKGRYAESVLHCKRISGSCEGQVSLFFGIVKAARTEISGLL